MATLYVTEYIDIGRGLSPWGYAQAPVVSGLQPSTEQIVTISGSSTQTGAFQSSTILIRVHTDSICSIKINTNPTATTQMTRLAANQTEYFSVRGGDRLAVITNV